MLTPDGVGFYSLRIVGVCRNLRNVDEVISPRFFMGPTQALGREIEGGLETRRSALPLA